MRKKGYREEEDTKKDEYEQKKIDDREKSDGNKGREKKGGIPTAWIETCVTG